MAVELWVAENTLDDLPRVAEPNFILRNLPFRWAGRLRWWVVVTQTKRFPGNVSKRN